MPKLEAKKILASGICTCPPSARALEQPLGRGVVGSRERQRKAMEARPLLAAPVGRQHHAVADLKAGMHHLVPGLGVTMPGSGLSL